MFDLSCGIRLRAFRAPPAGDLDNIISLYNNTQVVPFITLRFPAPRGEQLKKDYLDVIDKEAEIFCMIETIPTPSTSIDEGNQNGLDSLSLEPQFIGMTALWGLKERGHRHTKYSIVMLPKFWNRGYGQHITRFMVDHAFVHMNMHRISLEVYEGNDRAVALYKKTGFIEEGRQRKALWINGGWKDIIEMGILVEEWKEMQDSKT
ncbi:hypothetical protein CVT25_009557 [Psilocybe cyanescens]|uniref:N-acetyltransferase domain-containing protein n=1 Tax=Psilocybe cyanescens TaxID=93625 RepID=A0A409XV44_PSICY|nr:hypothetical protein CVT25_009557 [Psilocybe cyanescens]